ncbi:MAG TPA: hypothetical protein PKX99_05935 [Thermoanaerobaculia bacterium]|nr:hypothetical protein [Thermoanaerobaculia bacterium]
MRRSSTPISPGKPLPLRGWHRVPPLFAVLFGLLTIHEGGGVLFWSDAARQAAGHYVPFVLWFNFLAGFAYVAAGLGLWWRARWAVGLTFAIFAGTVVVFAAFGLHVVMAGLYETRTVAAMSVRTLVWFALSFWACRRLGWCRSEATGRR